MNITSVVFNENQQDLAHSHNPHIQDLCEIYGNNTSTNKFLIEEISKSKANIRIKRKSQSLKNINKNLNIHQQQPDNKELKTKNMINFPSNNETSSKRQLLFLRDLVSRKKEQITKTSIQTQIFMPEAQQMRSQSRQKNEQKRGNLHRLEGHKLKKQTVQQCKKNIEYEHYDMVVKDLLCQIKLKRQEKKARPIINNSTSTLDPKGRSLPKFFPSSDNQPTIKVNPKKTSMVFRMNQFLCDSVYEKKITSYVMFLYKINFSNSIYVDLSLSNTSKVYKVKIGHGNNHRLIKSIVKRRFWLQLTNSEDEANFIWTQNSLNSTHKSQKVFEKRQMKEKSEGYLKKFRKIKSLKNVDSFELNEKILAGADIKDAQISYYASNNGTYALYPKIIPQKITNHLPQNYFIASKKILFYVLNWYYSEILNVNPFLILPKTYHIHSGEVQSPAFKNFIQNEGKKPDAVWIVKPGQNTNQGNGITVASLSQISRLIRKKRFHKNGEQKTYIIQQYIKPFLYHNRKFDIRHYLLITSVNGFIKAYWYKDGYIRTSSEKYDIDDLSNQFIHLTNDSIQKRSESYGKYEEGNKLSYATFQRYLDTTYPQKKYSFEKQIISKMKEITKDFVHASFHLLDSERKQFNFQLYGMDFLIDSKFRPYLIEVNANPCLQVSCTLLQRIIPILTEHTFRLGLDPLLPPPQHFPAQARSQLSGKILQKIRYELIFDQKHEGELIKQKFKNKRPFELQKKEILQADEQIFENEGEECQQIELD